MATLQFTEGQERPPVAAHNAKQLLPNVVDGMSNTKPATLYAMIPNSLTSYDAGFRKVTYRDFANAVNGVAWFLSEKKMSKVVAYVGLNDIGYIFYLLGAAKAGHSLLLLSPRNTKADHAHLLTAARCNTILTTPPPYSPTVHAMLESLEEKPQIIHVPTAFELLQQKPAHYPYPKTYEQGKDEPLVSVHTSGTTNVPKLVTYTHAFAAASTAWTSEAPPEGYDNAIDSFRGSRSFVTFPFFHAGAIMIALFMAVPNQITIVTPLAGVPLSAKDIVEALSHVDVDTLYLTAPFMEQLAKNADFLRFVKSKVQSFTYGGGDVSDVHVQAFAENASVGTFPGSTETTAYPTIRPSAGYLAEDIKYTQPHPCVRMDYRAIPGSPFFEAVLLKHPDPKSIQPVFTLFPDLEEYHTKEMYSPHPKRAGLWIYAGRTDDMINSATGGLCNPVPLEQSVSQSPEVAAALMIGTGRYQKALLVEPADEEWCSSPQKRHEFVDRIFPVIEEANLGYPANSHIARSHVMVTDPGVPLKRAGKGTVQRAPSLALYEGRINERYEAAGDGGEEKERPYQNHFSL